MGERWRWEVPRVEPTAMAGGDDPDSPPRRLGRPPQAASAKTRANIVEAARWCFGQYGFDKTTNRLIAQRAGITTGAIYHYFDSKQQLFGVVADEMIDVVFTELEGAMVEGGTFAEMVTATLERSRRLHCVDESLARFVSVYPLEVQRNPDLLEFIQPDRQDRGDEFFLRMATRGLENEELSSSLSPSMVARMLNAMMLGMAYFGALHGNSAAHADAIAGAQALFSGGLFAVSPGVNGTTRSAPAVDDQVGFSPAVDRLDLQ